MKRAYSAASVPQDTPLGSINTTPLIDVLLVLIVMLVITIPVSANVTSYDLPNGSTGVVVRSVSNTLALTRDDAVEWNGTRVSRPELAALLHETKLMATEPQLEFRPDAQASYDASAKVLAIVKDSGVTNFGFVGNERYAAFGR